MSQMGQAGRKGDRVRSDCWISLEIRSSGGVELSLSSRVASVYGETIRGLWRDHSTGAAMRTNALVVLVSLEFVLEAFHDRLR